MQQDKRKFSRVTLNIPVTLQFVTGEVLSGEISNISMVGFALSIEKKQPIGSECVMHVHADANCTIEVKACIVRHLPEGIAVEIIGIDTAGLEDFRDLLIANAEDPDSMDVEIVSKSDQIPERY